jgi:hypothetical protein
MLTLGGAERRGLIGGRDELGEEVGQCATRTAHATQIVHRELKTVNVTLTKDDGDRCFVKEHDVALVEAIAVEPVGEADRPFVPQEGAIRRATPADRACRAVSSDLRAGAWGPRSK